MDEIIEVPTTPTRYYIASDEAYNSLNHIISELFRYPSDQFGTQRYFPDNPRRSVDGLAVMEVPGWMQDKWPDTFKGLTLVESVEYRPDIVE